LVGIIFSVLATIVSWLLTNESSPFSDYLLWNPRLRNYWGMLNFPSYLAGAMAAVNPHNVNEFVAWSVFLIQWMLFGIIVTVIGGAFWRRRAF